MKIRTLKLINDYLYIIVTIKILTHITVFKIFLCKHKNILNTVSIYISLTY